MPNLEFLANMNISPLTVEQLKGLGWVILRIPEIMDKKSRDEDILAYARIHNKVLITQDLDFSLLPASGGYQKPSVITLRLENPAPDLVTKRLLEVIPVMEEELKTGVVITVDETSARYRNLPILL